MLDDFRKSVNAQLYERVRSPLYGTFALSWLVWNWKFIYYLFTADGSIPAENRVAAISEYYVGWWPNLLGPVLTTAFLLVCVEWVANHVYRLHLYYKQIRVNAKAKASDKELMTLEQAARLRMQLRATEESFERIIREKDVEIGTLNTTIMALSSERDRLQREKTFPKFTNVLQNPEEQYQLVKEDPSLRAFLKQLGESMIEGISVHKSSVRAQPAFAIFRNNGLIDLPSTKEGNELVRLNDRGNELYRRLVNDEYISNLPV